MMQSKIKWNWRSLQFTARMYVNPTSRRIVSNVDEDGTQRYTDLVAYQTKWEPIPFAKGLKVFLTGKA